MVVHFVCMGNVYRSRLAEAYLNSLGLQGIIATSSGVQASMNLWGPIGSYTVPLLQADGILDKTAPHWIQVDQAVLDTADIVICVNREVYSHLKTKFNLPMRTFIWDITDINKLVPHWQYQSAEVSRVTYKTYRHIKQRVDELSQLLLKPRSKSMIDVLSPDGNKLGWQADVDTVNQKGLWHAGVHAVLYTSEGELLLQKRSKKIIGSPGLWDLSLGGFVDGGEEPLQALEREIGEELGAGKIIQDIKPLGQSRHSHFLPHYGLHSRVLLSSYAVKIIHPRRFSLQKKEVDQVRLLDIEQATRFVKAGHGKLGQTLSCHHYLLSLIKAVKPEILTVSV
ncbi:MAG TPA: NUDIX domain-containing protein [Candidatus Nanoarchaeia archaeon]|nr:NUDIX domain-containing protein [Candidatus Nanoarchaeia archaeon]